MAIILKEWLIVRNNNNSDLEKEWQLFNSKTDSYSAVHDASCVGETEDISSQHL